MHKLFLAALATLFTAHMAFAADTTCAAKAADTSGIADTTFTLSGLSPDTEYFWHVAAGNPAKCMSRGCVRRRRTESCG